MLDQLRLRVVELIRPRHPGPGAAPPPLPAPAAPAAIGEADFLHRLRGIVAESGSALAGRVNLLGLSRIKEHFGADWQRVAARAERIAASAIERRLTPRDIYCKWDDFDFILIFTDLTPAEAQIKCTLLAEEIARNLIGEEGAELIEVKTAIVHLDGSIDFESVPVREALVSLLHHVEPEPPPPPTDPLAGLTFRYRPMWDPERRNGVLFETVPLLPIGGNEYCRAYTIADSNPTLVARVDVAARYAALEQVAQLVGARQRLLLSIPIHFDTLARLSLRLDCVRALDALGEAEQRLVLFELLDVPHGVLQNRLVELTTPLRSRCYGVIARVDLDCRDFAVIREAGLRAVGVDVSAYSGSDEALIGQASRFERAARKAGLVAYLRGVRSPAVVTALRGAFAYIDGDPIAALHAAPARIMSLDFAES